MLAQHPARNGRI